MLPPRGAVRIQSALPHRFRQHRVAALQRRAILQSHQVQVRGVLDVGHAGLPEQVQDVYPPDVDVPDAVLQRRIPEHPVDSRAVPELDPCVIGVGLFQAAPRCHDRQDGAEQGGIRSVARFARQCRADRHPVAEVCVFITYAIEQPRGHRLTASSGVALGGCRFVAALPPHCLIVQACVQSALALSVAFQPCDGFPQARGAGL